MSGTHGERHAGGSRGHREVLRFRPGRYALHLGSFDRPNLWFGVVPVRYGAERLRALLELLRGDDQMIIVYVPTRGLTEAVARALVRAGHGRRRTMRD